MDNEMTDINEVIIKYLDGSATESEKSALAEWISHSAKNSADFMEIRDMWLASYVCEETDPSVDKAFGRFLQNIMRCEDNHKRRVFPKRWKLMTAAASLIILLGVGFSTYEMGIRQADSHYTVMNKLITASGSKGRFVLPDSTVVWLNANSTMTYPEIFADANRTVSLSGEAYFEVKHDDKHPFIVRANGLDVKVLGTHFVVENYPHRSTAEAVLVEGSVEVSTDISSNQTILTPGERLVFDKNNDDVNVSKVNPSDYISWINDKIEFDNRTLGDIVANLEKWFVVNIHCDPEVSRKFSITFSVRNGESLDEIMNSISIVAPISYYWKDNELYITTVKR